MKKQLIKCDNSNIQIRSRGCGKVYVQTVLELREQIEQEYHEQIDKLVTENVQLKTENARLRKLVQEWNCSDILESSTL